MRRKVFFLLLLTLGSASAAAEEDVSKNQGSLVCDFFGADEQSLAVEFKDGKKLRLEDLDFAVSPFVPPIFACQRWLETSEAVLGVQGRVTAVPILSRHADRFGRLDGGDRTRLYRDCHRSGLCRVKSPYNFGFWRVSEFFRDLFGEGRKDVFGRDGGICLAEVSKPAKKTIGLKDIRKIGGEDLKDVRFWFTPVRNFADEIIRMMEMEREGVLFASTMSVSSEEVEKLYLALLDHPKLSLYLLFDLNTNLAGEDIRAWAYFASEQFHLVPVSSRPDRSFFHHVKGAGAWKGKGSVVWTSGNLFPYRNSPLFDLGFTARGGEVADSLASELARHLDLACSEPRFLDCSLDVRLEPSDPLRPILRQDLAEACESFKTSGLRESMVETTGRYFVSTQDTEIVPLFGELVQSARRSVQGFSHRLDEQEVMRAVAAAASGKEARLYSRKGDNRVWEKAEYGDVLVDLEGRTPANPHSKFMMADGERALWGTGNFTRNGLKEAAEIFFYTDHPTLIEGLMTYARTSAPTDDGAQAPSERGEGSHYLWLTKDQIQDLPEGVQRESLFLKAEQTDREGRPSSAIFEAKGGLARCLANRPMKLFYGIVDLKDCAGD
jgi:hypothetical protein